MTGPSRRSLVFGAWCAVVGLLAGLAVSLIAEGGGWAWFPVASTQTQATNTTN